MSVEHNFTIVSATLYMAEKIQTRLRDPLGGKLQNKLPLKVMTDAAGAYKSTIPQPT